MGIFNIFGKRDVSTDIEKNSPFRISTELVPYRLYSHKKGGSSLFVRVRNMTKEVLLTSVVAELPEQLGFDEIGMAKQREVHVGELAPGEEHEVRMDVFNTLNADPGEYTLTLTAIAHYRDYAHVLNAVKKRTTLNVV
jgi:uncharacterized membrane protein